MQEQLQQLMTNHAALLDNLRNLAQQFDEAAKLAVTIGHQINRLSTLVDDSKTEPAPAAPRTGGHFHEVGSCYCDRWPPDATLREYIADAGGAVSVLDCMQSFELATHEQTITMLGEAVARKAIESTTDELGHVWYQLAIVNVPPSSEVRPVASIQLGAEQSGPAAVESVPSPPSGVRKKNEFTASQWLDMGGLDTYFEHLKPSHGLCGLDIGSRNRIREAFEKQFGASTVVGARWGSRIPAVARSIGFVVDL